MNVSCSEISPTVTVICDEVCAKAWDGTPIMHFTKCIKVVTNPPPPVEAMKFSKFIRKSCMPQNTENQMYLFTTDNRDSLIEWLRTMTLQATPLFNMSVIVNIPIHHYCWITNI